MGQDLIRHVRYESLRGLKTIDIHERVRDLAGGHPLGIHGDDLLIDVRNVFLPLLDDFRLKRGLAVLRNVDSHRTVAGVDSLFLVAVTVVIHLGFHHLLDGATEQVFESIMDIFGSLNVVFLKVKLSYSPLCYSMQEYAW